METTNLYVTVPLDFKQIVDVVFQLPYMKRVELQELLRKEIVEKEQDFVLTHVASENLLAREWLSPKEDEAWKDL